MRSTPDNRPLEVIYENPTRDTALDLLSGFLPRVRAYAAQRNFDVPGHPHVSCLSPAITLRLITETEVIAQVVGVCGRTASRRYVDEVLWRCYWKGWLELRPVVWQRYLDDCDDLLLHMDARTRYLYQTALRGETGIDCFDAWMHELKHSGYLHNHARMWLASIWVFRLGLPWQLGARLFLSELLDGDSASNTLSWRWVTGLHTAGKPYVASAGNVRKFTYGRFDPPEPLIPGRPLPTMEGMPGPTSIEEFSSAQPDEHSGLLLLGDDLSVERSALGEMTFDHIASGWCSQVGSDMAWSPRVHSFRERAFADQAERAARHFGHRVVALDAELWSQSLTDWCSDTGLSRVFCIAPTTGPWASLLRGAEATLARTGVQVVRRRHGHDSALWPHATGGYFAFRKSAKRVVEEIIRDDSDVHNSARPLERASWAAS